MINMASEEFCLRWNNFHTTVVSSFTGLRKDEEFVDVTIACDGKQLKAHKVVLSASSDFFRSLLKDNPCQHPIIILRDANYNDIQAILAFIYQGEVNVSQDRLASLLRTAEALRIKGLADSDPDQNKTDGEQHSDFKTDTSPQHSSPRRSPTPQRSPTPKRSPPPRLSTILRRSESPLDKRPRIDFQSRSVTVTKTECESVKNEPVDDECSIVEDDDDEPLQNSNLSSLNPDISASLRFYEQEDRLPDQSAEAFSEYSGLAGSSQSQNDHGAGSSQEVVLECVLCHMIVSSPLTLRRHVWEEHSTGTPFRVVCEILRSIDKISKEPRRRKT